MRFIIFLMVLLMLGSCDKRSCGCGDDLRLIKTGVESTSDVNFPNAVHAEGEDFGFDVISFQDEVTWEVTDINMSKGGQVFVSSADVLEDRFGAKYIPMENFRLITGDIVHGAVDMEISIAVSDESALKVSGSIYFYNCSDTNEDFDAKDCRWPDQLFNWAAGDCFSTKNPC